VTGHGIAGVIMGEARLGDYDGDGDADVLVTGATEEAFPFRPITRIYQNVNGAYFDIGADLEPVHHSSASWGDFDQDGDLDIALMGDRGEGDLVTRIYRNEGQSTFTLVATPPGVAHGSFSWGDFDADGDLDLLVAGAQFAPELLRGYVRILRNDGGIFTELPLDRDVAQLGMGEAAWADIDRDNDLDFVLLGAETPYSEPSLRAYRNEGGRFALEFSLDGLLRSALGTGDYNADGDIDFITIGHTQAGIRRLSVYGNQIVPDFVPDDGPP
jgi:hypothetical protein